VPRDSRTRLRSIENYREYVHARSFQDELAGAYDDLCSRGVTAVYFAFPSVQGRSLAKLITMDAFIDTATRGIRLHYGAIADARTDLFGDLIGFRETSIEGIGIPDLSTLAVLPWNPQFAQILCFLYAEDSGVMLDHDSRGNLLRVQSHFETQTSLEMRCAIEPEVMWLRPTPGGDAVLSTHSVSTYSLVNFHEQEALIGDLLRYSTAFGLRIHAIDSEESSQLEVNQAAAAPLAFADSFFRYRTICHAVASKHDLICTFMPKPFTGESGNGAHHNLSIVDSAERNHIHGELKGACRLSELGAHAVGGLLAHADAITMIGAATVNSYKRFWDVGHWAPFYKAYGYNNRTCLIRIPAAGRIEVRHFDAATNPYHSIAACVMASLAGIQTRQDPGEPTGDNVMRDIRVSQGERIPLTLMEAVTAFEADPLMRDTFPPGLHRAMVGQRTDEWHRFWATVSQWERDFYLRRWP
jgi:glutamine synthetase